MHVPKVLEIKRIIEETPTVKTFIFDWEVKNELPGQFVMFWNFKDEKPMSISLIDPVNDEIGVSIRNVGNFTEDVHSMKVGDKLGIRGPYGRGFEISGSKVLAVGGGIGMAPLMAFTEEACRRGIEVDVVSAAATAGELIFTQRIKKAGANLLTCTDDGSHGFCGFGTDLAEKALHENDYDMIVTCGPEIMMKKLFNLVDEHKIPAQFSLERYMKCGLGICGQCCVDDVGWRVCAEGPVFWTDEVRLISEFGKYHRDASGVKHTL
ncbi:dihydroorotate dehydrogenase electron transfer subunit [Methanobacterium aggregans]|uniref:dihydroorotate dehydrogenase electron transfer subunit n=1 Tax=Methanobacterium aggregans TaxID=1615586 RepID=UPI00320F7C50